MQKSLLTMLLSLIIPFTAVAQEAYAVYTTDGTLTFYYDNLKNSREGTKYGMNIGDNLPDWYYDEKRSMKKAVFDSSFSEARPTSTYHWFAAPYSKFPFTEIVGLQYLNTSYVTNMNGMFWGCSSITSLDLSNFNTEKVNDMYGMFSDCTSLTTLDLSNFNTEKVTDMRGMFQNCKALTSLDLSNFNTAKVTEMSGMFFGCSSLKNLNVSNFETSKVSEMSSMFCGCSALKSLDLSNFDTSRITFMGASIANFGMFKDCINLTTIYVGNGWNIDKVTSSDNMFLNCTSLVGGAGTKYDANHVDKAYAHIDGGPSNPGYFTDKNAGAEEEVCDADDLLRFIESLNGNTTTNDNPAEATLCDEPTIDQDVDIEDDLWLYLYGDDDITPPVMNFYGGAINLKSRNSGWTFKGVGFTSNAGTTAPLRAAGDPGGITSLGTLTFDGCTLKEGNYAIQNLSNGRMYLSGGTMVEGYGNLVNNGNAYIDGSVKVADLVNKKGGRIYVTSALTEDVKVSITTAADVEQGVAIILGGNGYTMTSADVSHITLTLPDGFEWKYNEEAGGIVVSTASGINSPHSTQPVAVDSYSIKGHKVSAGHQGMTIQRMSDGTMKKVMTNPSF